jgi:glycosyltransferase involved in cell wall biosynthesis
MPPASDSAKREQRAIVYVASLLPMLSMTIVYREMLGLRARGRAMIPVSLYAPGAFPQDAMLDALSREALIVYSRATLAVLPIALIAHPGLFARGVADALTADHPSLASRWKHLIHVAMGIATGWRLRRRDVGNVHAHMANPPSMVALYIARTLGAAYSFTGHAADLFIERTALGFKLRQADFVACISHWHRGFYREIAPIDPDRLPIVRCSVALSEARPSPGPEIVLVARLVAKKGIDLLIDAFARADLPGWTLRILGDGPEYDALRAQAAGLGIADRVVLEGAQPHAACLAAIAASEMLVLPCRTAANGDMDGIPVALMEAMAAGRAVIAGDLPAIRELIDDEESGLLVPPNDVDALAAAIRRVANDPALRETLGRQGRLRIETEFSDPVNFDRIETALDRVAAERAA